MGQKFNLPFKLVFWRFKNLVFLFFNRERVESLEKEIRIKSLQRSPGHSHSHDSAIDSDLQEWETATVDLDMVSNFNHVCVKPVVLYIFEHAAN
jgi:hypothetical protein